MRRVDPQYDPSKPEENGATQLLNIFEASHSDNWAWDEQGTLYPIDVEVVSFNRWENSVDKMSQWLQEQK